MGGHREKKQKQNMQNDTSLPYDALCFAVPTGMNLRNAEGLRLVARGREVEIAVELQPQRISFLLGVRRCLEMPPHMKQSTEAHEAKQRGTL